MRDKKRIKRIANLLEKVWSEFPDHRLGQLLVNSTGEAYLREVEDNEMEKALPGYSKKYYMKG